MRIFICLKKLKVGKRERAKRRLKINIIIFEKYLKYFELCLVKRINS